MKYFTLLLCMVALLSIGNSQSWEYVNNGLSGARYTYDIAFNGDWVLAATYNGIYRSSNQGNSWEKTPGIEFCHGIEVIDGVIYAMYSGGVKKSVDNGVSWTGMLSVQIRAIVKCNNMLFVAGSGGVQKSTNDGATWYFSNGVSGKLTNTNAHSLIVQGTDMYMGTFGGDNGGIFISRDYGTNWVRWEDNGKKYVRDMLATGAANFAAVSNDLGPMGILKCTNKVNWWSANIGIVNPYINCLGAYGSTLYAGNMANTPQGAVGGAYRSTDNGANWQLLNQGLLGYDIYGIQSNGTYVFIANWDKGVARYPVTPVVTKGRAEIKISAEDPWGLAGPSAHVKLWNNAGVEVEDKWANAQSIVIFEGLTPGQYMYKVYNARLTPWGEQFWGQGNLNISANNTTSFTHTHNTPFLPTQRVYAAQSGLLLPEGWNTIIPAGTQLRIEADVTHGTYPGTITPTSAYVSIYLDRDEELPYDIIMNSTLQPYTAGQTRSVVFFTAPTHNGSYSMSIGCYAQSPAYPIVLSDGGGWIGNAFKIEGGTSVPDPTLAKDITLFQNYPNPFNPTTTIQYSVEQSSHVMLKVVDVLGRETILVDEFQSKGGYRQTWTSPGTGMYFAVLEIAGQRRTIRMLAIK